MMHPTIQNLRTTGLATLMLLASGCSTLEHAALADGVSTIAAVGVGLSEGNPLGLSVVVLKIPLIAYVRTLPQEEQDNFAQIAAPIWSGASVNNWCMIASVVSGGTFAPVCVALGVGYGAYLWNNSRPQRDFYAACDQYRRVSGEKFTCRYEAQAESESTLLVASTAD